MSVLWLLLLFSAFSNGLRTRPDVVNIGAVLSLNSDTGKHVKIAIEEAVKDVNSNTSVLQHTKLQVNFKSSNCSAFLGLTQAMKYMETDVVAIIGPQSSVVAHTILSIAQEFTTPFLSLATDPTLSSIEFPYFVRTTHSDLFQMMAVAEVVSHYGWKQVTVIYVDDDYGRNGLAALDDALYGRRCRVLYKAPIPPRRVDRGGIMDTLVKVALMESRVIVVHVHQDVGLQIFTLAQDLGMSIGYAWIATDWLATALDTAPPLRAQTMMNDLQGVLMLRQHTPDSKKKRAFLTKWNNELAVGSLGLSTYALHAYDTVWLLAHAIDSFLNEGGNVSLSHDSKLKYVGGSRLHLEKMLIFDDGPLLLKNILKTEFVGLTGLFKLTSTGSLAFPAYEIVNLIGTGGHIIGYWSNGSGLSVAAPEILNQSSTNRPPASLELNSVVWPGEALTTPRGWVFPNNGNLLRIGVPLRVGYKEFVSQDVGPNNFKGFCIDVFLAAINLLPYAVPYKFIPFGNGRENPSYDELVFAITTGVFDGVVGDVTIVTNRTRIVDFTQPYAASGLVVVSSVKILNSGAWSFLRPFSHQLWGVCAAFFLLVGVVVWILEHRANSEFRGPPKRQIITILWFSFSTLFFSHKESTVSTLGRMVLLIWLFVVLIINSSYTASLTSILTLQQLYSPIKGIDSLKNSQDVVGFQVGSFSEQYLYGLGIPKSRLKPLGSLEAYADALERGPRRGGVDAVVDERPYVNLFLASQCQFRIIGEEFTKSGWGFAFARDSPLAVDLSTAILALSENGDLQRIHDKWLTTSSCSSDNTEMQLQSNRLHLQSFWVLYALAGGVCVTAIMMHFSILCCASRNTETAALSRSMDPHLGETSASKATQSFWALLDDRGGGSVRERKRRRLQEMASQRKEQTPETPS